MTTLGAPRYVLDTDRLTLAWGKRRTCTRCWSAASSRRDQQQQATRLKLPVSSDLADKIWCLLLDCYDDLNDDDEKEYAYL